MRWRRSCCRWSGYPIGLSGVVITIGQYQLLVNEACAGLQTMFTLEAMGLLYASLMNHSSTLRNALLAVLVVPIAFCANVVRVMVLALVTYHLGDAAGQGFLHGFAGMVLFVVALVLVMGVDALLGRLLAAQGGRAMNADRRQALVLAAGMGASALLATWLRPAQRGAPAQQPARRWTTWYRRASAIWTLDRDAASFVRAADRAAAQTALYDQVLERTFLHPSGQRIMLSLAYLGAQSSDMQLHRPEVCYRAGGFRVGELQRGSICSSTIARCR